MRIAWPCVLLLLGACAASQPPVENPASAQPTAQPAAQAATPAPAPAIEPAQEMVKWKQRPVDATCREQLAALAAARLDAFRGLGSCGRVDAEGTLGSSGDGPSKFEQMGEYRVFSHQGGSVLVWFLADEIRVAELLYPKLARPIDQLLGKPEARVKSELSPDWDQWVYASRGLSAHVRRGSVEVIALFAYKPTTVDAFLQTDIARISKSEAPLEDLK